MATDHPALLDSNCFLHDEPMSDWNRLGEYVVSRRVNLGHDTRGSFAEAAQIHARVLSDIENGRRGNYDKVTIAKLETALNWETGSVKHVTEGGEPTIREQVPPQAGDSVGDLLTNYQPSRDEALLKVMRSNLPDAQKRQIVLMLLAEREAAERRRAEHADELIQLLRGEEPQP
ncbi:helix-turn-helix domain-containing protein [Micromonosporaceae bacterium Da 78-11]